MDPSSGPEKPTGFRVSRSPLLLSRRLRSSPFVKNVLIGTGLMMVGEMMAEELKHCLTCEADRVKREQQILNKQKHQFKSKLGEELQIESVKPRGQFSIICDCWRTRTYSWTHIDIYEVARLGVFGAFQGTYQHFYYTWLDRKLIGSSVLVVAKKVVLDEIVVGPASLFLFFLYNGLWYTGTLEGGLKHTKNLFCPAYLADLACWPIVQTINFALVPTKYRVPYIAFFMCLWNSYLCLLNFKKVPSFVSPDRSYSSSAPCHDPTLHI